MQIKFGSILTLLAPLTASQFTLADEYADARTSSATRISTVTAWAPPTT